MKHIRQTHLLYTPLIGKILDLYDASLETDEKFGRTVAWKGTVAKLLLSKNTSYHGGSPLVRNGVITPINGLITIRN